MDLNGVPLEVAIGVVIVYTVFYLAWAKSIPLAIANVPIAFLSYFLMTKLFIWWLLPPMVGAWGGWQFLIGDWLFCSVPYAIAMAITTGIVIHNTDSKSSGRSLSRYSSYSDDMRSEWLGLIGTMALGFIALVLCWGLIGNMIAGATQTWGDGNMQRYVKAANITTAGKQMPPSDPTHIVMVTRDIAAYLGQTVLSTTGQNLGSKFHFEHDEYVLQSVHLNGQDNLYWIAPMNYNNVQQQVNNYDSPGYVMVDAENPNTSPILVEKDLTGRSVQFHYNIGLPGDRDLVRHLYLQGYNQCNLVDPTVEVDNSLRPWFTVLCADSLNGFEGFTIKSVILVDPTSGKAQSYAPGKQPSWIDRVVPTAEGSDNTANTAEWYVDKWARYLNAPWNDIGTGGAGEMKRDGSTEVVYDFVHGSDAPAYLMPITSNNDSDTTSTGFMLYSTQTLKGTYYPLSGIQIGEPVVNTFANFSLNIQHYAVAGLRLYNLYGTPTWVAIYQQSNSAGASFQKIGMVDARNLNGNNVIWANNLDDALSQYQQMLATEGNNTQIGTSTSNGKTLTGTIERLVSQTANGVTTYTMILTGSTHLFTVQSSLAGAKYLNVAQVGDKVTIQYNDTGAQLVSVLAFNDLTVDQLMSTNGATPAPSPSATPSK